eukprot:s855_g36.t1
MIINQVPSSTISRIAGPGDFLAMADDGEDAPRSRSYSRMNSASGSMGLGAADLKQRMATSSARESYVALHGIDIATLW